MTHERHCPDKPINPTTLTEVGLYAVQQFKKQIDIVLLKWIVHYSEKISCSHNAPRGQPVNWGGNNKTTRTGYPGWEGRVWAFYAECPEKFCSDYFYETSIYVGTGGYGLYDINISPQPERKPHKYYYNDKFIYPVSYDCTIFLDDFPGIKTRYLITEEIEHHHKFLYDN